ncbi:MAG: Heat shock protein 60 family chaperone GroEL, partial [uncultured Thermomicrobiales bacterium]
LAAPGARRALLRGVDAMAALVRPTLGPLARTVMIAGNTPRTTPEVLDGAATIMRRTIQIDDPFADMGAMLVRQLAWTVFERVGDGAATAVTLAQALLHAAATPIAAGANPQALRRGIEQGLIVARDELRRQARPVDAAADLAAVITGGLRDPDLAGTIGEVVEAVGPDGAVLVEEVAGTTTSAEYIDGQRWERGLLSPYLLPAGEAVGRLIEPRILITDRALTGTDDLLPTLEACIAAGERQLLVIAPEVGDAALALLIVNRERGVLDGALAVRSPEIGEMGERVLEDLAVATGGRAIIGSAGGRLAEVTLADLGQARQVWATADAFNILGGRGDKGAIRRRIGEAKAELRAVTPDDDNTRRRIRERIGKLAGTAARLYVGAPTGSGRAELRARVEAAVVAAQTALREGGVPGGGGALLHCVPALERLVAELPADEALGARILGGALPAPLRAIAANGGIAASEVFDDAHSREPGWTFDVLRRQWVDAWEGGIIDPLPVVLAALEGGVSTALMALTTDVLIRRKKPPLATTP